MTTTMTMTTLRTCGLATAAGGLTWGALLVAAEPGSRAELAGGLVWQLGAAALLAVLHATHATGTSRWGRGVLAVTAVLLALATVWSVVAVAAPGTTGVIFSALDAAWPLSQVGLLATGVTVAARGRWPGATRWLPLLGGLWLPVSVLAAAGGDAVATAVSAGWIALTYGAIGLAVAGPVAAAHGRGATVAAEARRGGA